MTKLWLNGALIDATTARINPADRGFTLGDGLFETIRLESGHPLHFPRHMARLRHGASVLRIELPCAEHELLQAIINLAATNHLQEAAARLTLTRGPAPRGVLPTATTHPTVLITTAPLPPPQPPARLITATITRRNETSPLSRIKSLNYGDSILARQEAAARGADDALLLNTQGFLAEATAANVFLSIAGQLITPPIPDGALPGIRRALLLESGTPVERRITAADLARAQSGFLANALGLRQIASVDGRALLGA